MSLSNSFSTYRKPSDEIITSDEDEVIGDSFASSRENNSRSRSRYRTNRSQSDKSKTVSSHSSVEVEDSSESDYEIVVKPKNKQRARILTESEEENSDESKGNVQSGSSKNNSNLVVSEESESQSDNTEDEAYYENRALSPKTRMSITGFRPRDMSDNDSDFLIEEAAEIGPQSVCEKSKGQDEASRSNLLSGESGNETNMNSRSSESSKTTHPFTDDEEELHSFDPEQPPLDKSAPLTDSHSVTTNANDSTDGKLYRLGSAPNSTVKSDAPRLSTNFNCSIAKKMSSTIISSHVGKKGVDSSPVILVDSPIVESPISLQPVKGDTIEISSSPETSLGSTSTPSRGTEKNLVQPKILNLLNSEQTSNTTTGDVKYVSREHYEAELKKMSDLKAELSTCENLINTLGSKLPDKGKRMSGRGERLKQEIANLALYISTLKVDESFKKEKIAIPKLNTPTWEELTKAANAIQPTHTGKVGMANFVAQKTLTIERLKDIHGSLENCPDENVLAEDPKHLKVDLMNHQRHALAWMNWREKQKPRGGILADDMGLGKTLTMISLILASNYKKQESTEEESSDSESDGDGSGAAWVGKNKRECFYGGTLIVCPASLIRQWEGEVENRVKRSKLAVCVYHGNNRETKPRKLAKYDMVVTTYNLISRENKSHSTLFTIKWERVILDEAHVIRNHKSQVSEAACNLKGKRRWALTGTPIQNKEMDLYALLKFLRCSPFDDLNHWKRWIDNKSAGGQQRLNTLMKSLMLRRTKDQLQELGRLTLPERTTELVEVTLDKEEMAVYQKVLFYSRTLFAQFLHQRAEKNHDYMFSSGGGKPPYTQNNKSSEPFLKVHEKFIKMDRRKEVKSYEILVLLLRLRQICCHPGLIDSMLEDDSNVSLHGEDDSLNGNHQEIDLMEQLNNLRINDGDSSTGLSESLNGSKEEAISKALAKALLKSNPVFNISRLSSKMRKVVELIDTKIIDTSEKALIVSQWTSVLEILRAYFARKGISTVSLNGTVPVGMRNGIVNDFNNPNSSKKIMLLSLTAGGVGLNLVGANHLLMIDLHWNPQLEAQAQDRIYRVGQKKTVHVYKFMCKETVEERIKKLQEQKIQIANSVLTGTKASEGSKLSIDDLKNLFGL